MRYESIENLFIRDTNTHKCIPVFKSPVVQYLNECAWYLTEKIDGMNIRVIFDNDGEFVVRGRSDKAVLAEDLVQHITALFDTVDFANVIVYGEGYGGSIQKGSKYGQDKKFIMFDIATTVDGKVVRWMPFADVCEQGEAWDIPVVPVYGTANLKFGTEMVADGLHSHFGDFTAEGIVARPLCDNIVVYGRNLKVKIKHRDIYNQHHLLGAFKEVI
jgi:hypothetical protein